MSGSRKVYDFSWDKVRSQVATAFRKQGLQGTVADVVSRSGLPKHQVESVLPSLVSDCRGQMAVTESGEVIYRFPLGLRFPAPRWTKALARAVGRVLTAVFKAWIVVMLVGYFVLFVVVLIAAVLASIAMSAARRDDNRDDGGLLGGLVVGRVFEMFLLLWLYSGDVDNRRQKKTKPFHKAVFEFVFGVPDPEPAWIKQERKAVIAVIQERKGVLTLEELMAITGRPRGDADALMSRLLLEFDGEPQVSERGTLYFSFPELMRTTDPVARSNQLPERELIPFTRNPSSVNRWIFFLNGFNVVLGGYFLAFGLHGFAGVQAAQDPSGFLYLMTVVLSANLFHTTIAAASNAVLWVLGVVPSVYSAFFFGIPLVRRLRERAKNTLIRINNLRRRVVQLVLRRPSHIDLASIEPDHERNAAGKPGPDREKLKQKMVQDLAGDRAVDVPEPEVLAVKDLADEVNDIESLRQTIDLGRYRLGAVVFDTDKPVS